MNAPSKQNGMTLVEILISITISLFILAGITQVFISSKQAYRLGSAFNEIQENGHFLSQYIPKIVNLSGYRTPPTDSMFAPLNDFFPVSAPHLQVINDLGTNGSDILTVRYQGSGDGAGNPDGFINDCLNQPLDTNNIVTNTFSINANQELECQSINPDAGGVSTQVLVSGVENMQILLGEDTDGDRFADRYVAPNFAGINVGNIVSMRMSVLVRSTNEIYKAIDNNTYNLLGTEFTPTPDYRIRKEYTFTIYLKNVFSL